MQAIRCSSSLRALTVAETLARARELAPGLGVARVTDITRLDRVGLPVFISVRPGAERHSTCVSAGKGLRPEEAEVGAVMEAIELAWAEHRRCALPIVAARVADLGTPERPFGVLDHCPVWGTRIDLDAPIACIAADDVATGARTLVPAEAVIHPLPRSVAGVRYFGTHSNGLASGNTVEEATVHGLAEVLERDTISFHLLRDRARLVRTETLPEPVRALADRLRATGFELIVRWLPNAFGLPAFTAVIFHRHQPELASPGDGLHPVREIALVRAVTETAQARLGFIHGGRDDLADIYGRYAHLTADDKAAHFERHFAAWTADPEPVDYAALPDLAAAARDLPSALATLLGALGREGLTRVLRVAYTPADYPVQVVRVIVPGLELHSKDTLRVGPRLLAAIRSPQAAGSSSGAPAPRGAPVAP
ncbi:MAG: YcaO-like family protein [Deltaproteobacteria bacterium]|nr:YcaO-like family protein [Deltaproteobacteria bacterium]